MIKIRAGLQAVDHPESNFAGHSFRIGAAIVAVNAGLEDSTSVDWEDGAMFLPEVINRNNDRHVNSNQVKHAMQIYKLNYKPYNTKLRSVVQ